MKIFGAYIKQKSKILLTILLFCIIFAIVFYLYKLPVEAVIYPSLLCILFGAILMVLDFAKIKRRYKILEKLGNMPSAMIDELPSVSNINDYGYQRIIRSLQKEISQLESDSNNRFNDMVDYYTVWHTRLKHRLLQCALRCKTRILRFQENCCLTCSVLNSMLR